MINQFRLHTVRAVSIKKASKDISLGEVIQPVTTNGRKTLAKIWPLNQPLKIGTPGTFKGRRHSDKEKRKKERRPEMATKFHRYKESLQKAVMKSMKIPTKYLAMT